MFTIIHWQRQFRRALRTMHSMWSTQEELWLEYTGSPELEEALHWVRGPDGMRLVGSVMPSHWH